MTHKRQPGPRGGGQQGSALVWAMIAVGVVGSAGYYVSQRSVNDVKAYDVKQASDTTETGNISNLAIMQSLVRFPKASCSQVGPGVGARDPACVPKVYFEPYVTGSPALQPLQGTPDATLWSANGANSFNLYSYNPRGLTQTDFTNIFASGALPNRGGATALPTRAQASPPSGAPWAQAGFAATGATTVPVQADASQVDSKFKTNNTVTSSLVAEIQVPSPPPPQCDLWEGFSGNSLGGAPYGLPGPLFEVPANGATVGPPTGGVYMAFGMQGYGVFTQAGLSVPMCAITIPAGASSVHNDGAGSTIFSSAQCTYDLTNLLRGGAMPPGSWLQGPIDPNGNDPFAYYILHLTNGQPLSGWVANSWGGATTCTNTGQNLAAITLRYRKAPICAWAADPFVFQIDGKSHPITMWTKFSAWAAAFAPETGWVSQPPGYPNGQLVNYYNTAVEAERDNERGYFQWWIDGHNPNPWGYAWGVDGQTSSCGTAIWNGRNAYCSWHGHWVQFGQCMDSGSYQGFDGWTSFAALPYPRYVDYGSVWECYAELYQTSNCSGPPAYLRTHPGCFTPETEIRDGDGELRRIDQLHEGDYVLNPIRKQKMRIKKMIAGDETKDLVEYQADVGRPITVTSGHPVPTARGLLKAVELKADDAVLGADGAYHSLLLLRSVKPAEKQVVWNIELDTDSKDPDDRMLEANGFVVTGDFVEQQQVEQVKP